MHQVPWFPFLDEKIKRKIHFCEVSSEVNREWNLVLVLVRIRISDGFANGPCQIIGIETLGTKRDGPLLVSTH
jgi:hypothetical protein